MKTFFKKLILILSALLLILIILDMAYTGIYKNPIHARSKVSWLMNLRPNQDYDYAIFGSSRAFFHLNPKQIKAETGLNGINLAYPAADNFEIKLMVKEFLKNHNTPKMFIQVDDRYNNELPHDVALTSWIPFIKEEAIYNDIYAVDKDIFYKRYIPFYRYMAFDSKLGFREVLMSFFKPNQFNDTNGFTATIGELNKKGKAQSFKLADEKNEQLETVIDICREENIELFFFTAPYFNVNVNTEVLKKQLPNYIDFSDVYEQMSYFSDPSHLSKKGAQKFTNLFSNTYFSN